MDAFSELCFGPKRADSGWQGGSRLKAGWWDRAGEGDHPLKRVANRESAEADFALHPLVHCDLPSAVRLLPAACRHQSVVW